MSIHSNIFIYWNLNKNQSDSSEYIKYFLKAEM